VASPDMLIRSGARWTFLGTETRWAAMVPRGQQRQEIEGEMGDKRRTAHVGLLNRPG